MYDLSLGDCAVEGTLKSNCRLSWSTTAPTLIVFAFVVQVGRWRCVQKLCQRRRRTQITRFYQRHATIRVPQKVHGEVCQVNCAAPAWTAAVAWAREMEVWFSRRNNSVFTMKQKLFLSVGETPLSWKRRRSYVFVFEQENLLSVFTTDYTEVKRRQHFTMPHNAKMTCTTVWCDVFIPHDTDNVCAWNNARDQLFYAALLLHVTAQGLGKSVSWTKNSWAKNRLAHSCWRLSTRMHVELPALQLTLWEVSCFLYLLIA